jgi:hypothetical protein
MKIIHKGHKGETGKTIHLRQINNRAGYRERIAFAANIASRHDMFGNNQIVSARYSSKHDKWFGDAGNFECNYVASIYRAALENSGFYFVDDED